GTYDHTSVLKMIEWRWNLPALTVRDAAAANLAEALDFTSPPNLDAPQWNVPAVTGLPCPAGQYVDYENWNQLAALAQSEGWPTG
ncbi:MAG TPA: phospholipase, partial [Trebonia sp.]